MDNKTPVQPALLPVDFLWMPLCCVHLCEAVSSSMSYFQLQSLRNTVIWRPDFQFTKKMEAPVAAFLNWNWTSHQVLCPPPPPLLLFCRCWRLFRSGVAFQRWSRSCFDAVASSSTAPAWACRSWPPRSGPTPAPRGQTRLNVCASKMKWNINQKEHFELV